MVLGEDDEEGRDGEQHMHPMAGRAGQGIAGHGVGWWCGTALHSMARHIMRVTRAVQIYPLRLHRAQHRRPYEQLVGGARTGGGMRWTSCMLHVRS